MSESIIFVAFLIWLALGVIGHVRFVDEMRQWSADACKGFDGMAMLFLALLLGPFTFLISGKRP